MECGAKFRTASTMSSSSSPPTTSTEGGHNVGKTIIAVTWSLIALTMVAVGARLFGRVVLTRNVGWDDFWIIVSLVRLHAWLSDHNSRS